MIAACLSTKMSGCGKAGHVAAYPGNIAERPCVAKRLAGPCRARLRDRTFVLLVVATEPPSGPSMREQFSGTFGGRRVC